MNDAYTSKDLAPVLSVTDRAIRDRAVREKWSGRPRTGKRGRPEIEYLAASLPADVKAALAAAEAKAAPELPAIPVRPGGLAALDDKRRAGALAKADLLALYLDWLRQAPAGGKTSARDQFVAAYDGGAWPQLREVLGEVSWKTIEAWKRALRQEKSPAALADRRGLSRKGNTRMSDEAARILVAQALHPNAPNVNEIIRRARAVMAAQGVVCDLSDRRLRGHLEDHMRRHYGTWVYSREGKKAWNDKAAYILERDYDRIEVGDILVADGHVLNFEVLNPETGRAQRMELVVWYDMKSNMPCGWEIMPTENVACIAAALRRAVLMLGKLPRVAYLDNGKAFRAQYFNGTDFSQSGIAGLFEEIGVRTIFAWPYHGQSKTIERFFGTFHDLESWVPSYVGNAIAAKPPRLKRGEQLHRKLYERSGRPLTILEAHTAVAWWFQEYGKRPQRGHLNGAAPWEVFSAGRGPGVDSDRLRHLMLARKTATIHRNGIKHLGEAYWHPELYGRRHEVTVRYDLHDAGYVLVELPDGRTLECLPPAKTHPAARLLGTAEDVAVLEEGIALKKQQERQASSTVRELLTTCVIPETTARLKLVEARREPEALPASPIQPSQAVIARIEAAKSRVRQAAADRPAYTPPAEMPTIITALQRCEYLFRLRERDGMELTPEDAHWLAEYEAGDEFRTIFAERAEQLQRLWSRQRQAASA